MKLHIASSSMLLSLSLCPVLTSCSGGSSSKPSLGWVPTFGPELSPDDRVFALTRYDDGSGNGQALYVGGFFFASAGSVELHTIGKWDGSTWAPLGTGTTIGMNGPVHALTVFDEGSSDGPELYAAGGFTSILGEVEANRIAKWNGTTWSALGDGMNSFVHALTVFDDGSGGGPALYAGGIFISAGGQPANRIARWDGNTWSALDEGMNGSVRALCVFDEGSEDDPALYAGGSFTSAGGKVVNHVAKWDGSAWSALSVGLSSSVLALTVFDDGSGGGPALCAGGEFTAAGEVAANHIAKWDGNDWKALGGGMNDFVSALTVFDDGSGGGPALYAGGAFSAAGGVQVNGIAKWDGNTWSALGAGVSGGAVFALAEFDDGSSSGGIPQGPSLFAGGDFPASPAGDPFLAKWGRSQDAVLFGPEGSQQLTSLHAGAPELEDEPCALTARIGTDLRLDDPDFHLLLEHAHVAPQQSLVWLAGTIELRGGLWRQAEPLVLGIAGPARLVLAEGARLEIPRVIVGPQGELGGAGLLLGDLENQGLVVPSASGLELFGRYLESPPGSMAGGVLHQARGNPAGLLGHGAPAPLDHPPAPNR